MAAVLPRVGSDIWRPAATSLTFIASKLTATHVWRTGSSVDCDRDDSGTSPTVAAAQFTYGPTPVPIVSEIAPHHGSPTGGTIVTIHGSGFTSGARCISEAAGHLPPLCQRPRTHATAPSGSGTPVDVIVTVDLQPSLAVAADQFTFDGAPAPTVSDIYPHQGLAGTAIVTIYGSWLYHGSKGLFRTP